MFSTPFVLALAVSAAFFLVIVLLPAAFASPLRPVSSTVVVACRGCCLKLRNKSVGSAWADGDDDASVLSRR